MFLLCKVMILLSLILVRCRQLTFLYSWRVQLCRSASDIVTKNAGNSSPRSQKALAATFKISTLYFKLFVSCRDPCTFLYSLNHVWISIPRVQGASPLVLGSCSVLSFFVFTLCSYHLIVSHLQRVTSLCHTLTMSWCHCNSPFVLTPFSSAYYRSTLTQLSPIKCPCIVVKSNRTHPDSRKSVSSSP